MPCRFQVLHLKLEPKLVLFYSNFTISPVWNVMSLKNDHKGDTVSVDADLYVLLGLQSEELWLGLQVNFADGPRSFAARHQEVVRELQILPEGMDDWRYEHIYISSEAVAKRATPVEVPTSSLALIPDTLGWSPLQIVSSRFKQFLETEFPDGSHFYPFSYRDSGTKEVKHPEFWFWLPKHKLNFKPHTKRSRDQCMRPNVWGVLGGLDTTWEMHHNKTFQHFVADLPYWTPSADFGEIVFRSDVYHRLKALGFTGFIEAKSDNYLRHTPEQSVGFIHYAK